MTIDEFQTWIKAGKKLVTIDNLVLDIGSYSQIHPGGKFALQQTVGRDISKFFYGGFSILSTGGSQAPHIHSMKALAIAEEMVVAKIANQEDIGPVITRIVKKTKMNKDTSTFCFETIDSKPVSNFHYWFEDLNMIGRHYLIAAVSNPNLMRQYTVCNTMIPEFYDEIFKVCQQVIEGEQPTFDQNWFELKNENRMNLTLKNYKQPTGLSAKIHAQKVHEGANTNKVSFASSV